MDVKNTEKGSSLKVLESSVIAWPCVTVADSFLPVPPPPPPTVVLVVGTYQA